MRLTTAILPAIAAGLLAGAVHAVQDPPQEPPPPNCWDPVNCDVVESGCQPITALLCESRAILRPSEAGMGATGAFLNQPNMKCGARFRGVRNPNGTCGDCNDEVEALGLPGAEQKCF